MNWTAHHNRGDVLRNVVKVANSRQDGLLPMDVDGVAQTFRSDLDLIGALQLRWHTLLAGNIERALVEEPGEKVAGQPDEGYEIDLEVAVLASWAAASMDLPGVRAILDHHGKNPTSPEMAQALDIANRKDWALMAVMAGMASAQDSDAAEVGRRLEAKVRRPGFVIPTQRVRHLTLIERLRLALAA